MSGTVSCCSPNTPFYLVCRYDQLTQLGRFKHFFDMADPRCLLPSIFFGMSLDEATAELIAAKARLGSRPQTTQVSDRVWLANKIYTSAVHPDTREIIPQPFRMSGFAVYGNPIVVGMLLPNPTGSIAQTVFWQWVSNLSVWLLRRGGLVYDKRTYRCTQSTKTLTPLLDEFV